MAATSKLIAEAGLSEVKMILGWRWDFRRLIISLPDNKYAAWTTQIEQILHEKSVMTTKLETTIGRLTHLSLVVPFVHHFLSRLRNLHTTSIRRASRQVKITPLCDDDLNLMLTFLKRAHAGIDMNQIAYRRPTHIY